MERHKKEGGTEHNVPSLGVILEKGYNEASSSSSKKQQQVQKKNKGIFAKGKGSNNKSGATSEDGEESPGGGGEGEGDLVTALSLYFLRVELKSREGKEEVAAMAPKADFSNPRFILLYSSFFC